MDLQASHIPQPPIPHPGNYCFARSVNVWSHALPRLAGKNWKMHTSAHGPSPVQCDMVPFKDGARFFVFPQCRKGLRPPLHKNNKPKKFENSSDYFWGYGLASLAHPPAAYFPRPEKRIVFKVWALVCILRPPPFFLASMSQRLSHGSKMNPQGEKGKANPAADPGHRPNAQQNISPENPNAQSPDQ